MNRQSNYNYFIPYKEDRMLYYNAVTHNSFIMNINEHTRIYAQFADPISFELEYPTVFRKFKEWGFFVEEGADEIAPLRFAYNKEIIYSADSHIILHFNKNPDIWQDFIETIKKHLNNRLTNNHLPQLCIEWNGIQSLFHHKNIITPLAEYIRTICNKQHIKYHLQLEVVLEMNETLHDKIHHEKGISTYKKTIQQIEELCHEVPDISILLRIGYDTEDKNKQAIFIKQFSSPLQLIFQWEQKKYDAFFHTDKKPAITWSNPETEDERWYNIRFPRINQYLITDDRNVYFGKKSNSKDSDILGMLNTEGQIEWDEAKRIKILGSPWFETDKCRECKHLFLFSNICPHITTPPHPEFCLKELNLITPETFIIQEFEQKK